MIGFSPTTEPGVYSCDFLKNTTARVVDNEILEITLCYNGMYSMVNIPSYIASHPAMKEYIKKELLALIADMYIQRLEKELTITS